MFARDIGFEIRNRKKIEDEYKNGGLAVIQTKTAP